MLRDALLVLMEGQMLLSSCNLPLPLSTSLLLSESPPLLPLHLFYLSSTTVATMFYLSSTGAPRHVDYNSVKEDLKSIPGVKHVHSVHIWSLTMSKTAIAAHLALGEIFFSLTFFLVFATCSSFINSLSIVPLWQVCLEFDVPVYL